MHFNSVIILFCNLFFTSMAWNPPGYYGDYYPPHYYRHFPYYGKSFSTHENYFQQQCDCIKLKECTSMLEIISKSQIPMSESLIANLRKTSCGFQHNEPLVCCPREHFGKKYPRRAPITTSTSTTTEEPWVWDSKSQSSEDYSNEYFGKWGNHNSLTKNHNNNFGSDSDENDYHQNLVDFEDPNTHKNCPPSFYEEFDVPPKFARKKLLKNKNIRKLNENDRFDSTSSSTISSTTSTAILEDNRNSKESLVNSPFCGISINTRIVGGRDAGPGQFPWMARLAYRNRTSGRLTYRCAGSVISDRYIVTAAHCVTNLVDVLEVYLVRIGELDTTRNLDCNEDPIRCVIPQDYEIDRIIPHANYDTPKYANDIALIRLVRPFNTTMVAPLCLPMGNFANADNDNDLAGKTGIIAGWGSNTQSAPNASPSLQWIRLPVVNRTSCAISYAQFSANSRSPIIVSESQLCAQGMENLDACQGDSGGPLMSEGTENNLRYIMLGLVSFGPRTCGVSNFPGVYTRVSSYVDWMMSNMEE